MTYRQPLPAQLVVLFPPIDDRSTPPVCQFIHCLRPNFLVLRKFLLFGLPCSRVTV